ncbi:BMP family lipoprotein [Sutcliffiella cohnii]
MKKYVLFLLLLCIVLTGCMKQEVEISLDDHISVGIMLSDVGLGDQSFSDASFSGLIRAREELNIIFSYRELADTGSYEQGLVELVKEKHDLIIGLGFMIQEDLEKVAKEYPNQNFVLIDAVSTQPNITSIIFKEDEGSFLAGVLAASLTETEVLGFIGGADVPLIRKFLDGFEAGAKAMNSNIEILSAFPDDFGNPEMGASITNEMIDNDADILFAAAGLTGVGMLQEAEKRGKYAIGVDSDQYFYAEKAVVSSMQKHVDVAIFNMIESLSVDGTFESGTIIEFGLNEGGIGLSPIRVVNNPPHYEAIVSSWSKQLLNENDGSK